MPQARMTERLWRKRILEPGRAASSVKFCANTAGEQQRGSAQARIDTALADAASCSSRSFIDIWNSLAVFQKRPATRDAFLHAAVLGNSRRVSCPRNCARFLAAIAPMDAAHVADFYGCNSLNGCLGRYYDGFALASAAVLSRTLRSFTKFDQ